MSNDGPGVHATKALASKVLFALSLNFFNTVFSRISTKLQELSGAPEEVGDYTDLELIQHINVDLDRLTKLISGTKIDSLILNSNQTLCSTVVHKFKLFRKSSHLMILGALERVIWNWMTNYPYEFSEFQRNPGDELSMCCDQLFDALDAFSESKKGKIIIWPLQMMFLILSPVSKLQLSNFKCKNRVVQNFKVDAKG